MISSAKRPSMATSMILYTYLFVSLLGASVVGLVHPRQEDASTTDPMSSATPTASEAGESRLASSISATTTPSTDASDEPTLQTTTSAKSAAPSASVPANGTSLASATSSASNATISAPPSSGLNETNDPNECHATNGTGSESRLNPFCAPRAGTRLDMNSTYYVTWDPTVFDLKSNVTLLLIPAQDTKGLLDPSANRDPDALFNTTVPANKGSVQFNTTPSMLKNSTFGNLTFYILDVGASEEHKYFGPTFTLVDDTTSANNDTSSEPNTSHNSTGSGGGSSKSKELGKDVGAPIGSIALVAILAIIAFFLYRRYGSRGVGSDYLSRKSHSQRTTSTGGYGAAAAATAGRSHRRTESFHDEPTRGMELQDRGNAGGAGAADNWDWGRDSVSSPTSPGRSNVFRDEISRQNTAGRR